MGFEADFEKWKKECFSPYCITKCEKMCCDMGNVSLYVYKDELMRIYDGKVDFENLGELGIKAQNVRGIFSIESGEYCRKFDSNTRKCLDYDNRPLSCREYPFIVENDSVLIKSGCSLAKGGLEFKKLAEIGVKYGKVIVKK